MSVSTPPESVTAGSGRGGARYPVLDPLVELHRNPDGGYLLVARELRPEERGAEQVAGRKGADRAMQDNFRLEGYLLDYLTHVDGRRDRAQLDQVLVAAHGPHFGPLLAERCWNWLLRQDGIVTFRDEPAAESRAVRSTGGDGAFYPMHAVLEIIETCNFACDHCYYSSAPWKKGRIALADAITVMDRLAANGVRLIELTGGECTIHPDFPAILEYASRTFELVAVITNGYRIGMSETFAAKVTGVHNAVFQVSIDALGERHDTFRKHTKAFEAAVRAIERLVAAGRPVRMASSIGEEALPDVPGLVELGRELGVMKHTFAPVAPIGRGCNVTDAGAASADLTDQLNSALRAASYPLQATEYVDIPDGADIYEQPRNCGAGWRSFTVDYDAKVRACNFARESKKFGDLLVDDYRDIFGQQANFYFNNAPSPGGRDCEGCRYRSHCTGCFVKAFMVSETEYPECPWRRRWFPDMPLTQEENRDGHLPAAEKRRRVPAYSVEDSTQLCTSCTGDHAGPLARPGGADLADPVGRAPVFLGASIGFGG